MIIQMLFFICARLEILNKLAMCYFIFCEGEPFDISCGPGLKEFVVSG